MSVIILLVIVGVIVAGLFLLGFIWSVKSGQYDDMYSPSVRMLFDDTTEATTEITDNKQPNNSKNK